MTTCEACGKLPAAILAGEKQLCILCAMTSGDPGAERQIREMGLTETELKRMRKTVSGEEFPAAEAAAPQEIPLLTEIPGIEVVSPAYPQEAPAPAADTPRFRLTGSQPFGDRILLVFTDTKTGVQYVTNDDLCGFSPLLDAEGRPLTN